MSEAQRYLKRGVALLDAVYGAALGPNNQILDLKIALGRAYIHAAQVALLSESQGGEGVVSVPTTVGADLIGYGAPEASGAPLVAKAEPAFGVPAKLLIGGRVVQVISRESDEKVYTYHHDADAVTDEAVRAARVDRGVRKAREWAQASGYVIVEEKTIARALQP